MALPYRRRLLPVVSCLSLAVLAGCEPQEREVPLAISKGTRVFSYDGPLKSMVPDEHAFTMRIQEGRALVLKTKEGYDLLVNVEVKGWRGRDFDRTFRPLFQPHSDPDGVVRLEAVATDGMILATSDIPVRFVDETEFARETRRMKLGQEGRRIAKVQARWLPAEP